jgi:hypothetical protein
VAEKKEIGCGFLGLGGGGGIGWHGERAREEGSTRSARSAGDSLEITKERRGPKECRIGRDGGWRPRIQAGIYPDWAENPR